MFALGSLKESVAYVVDIGDQRADFLDQLLSSTNMDLVARHFLYFRYMFIITLGLF